MMVIWWLLPIHALSKERRLVIFFIKLQAKLLVFIKTDSIFGLVKDLDLLYLYEYDVRANYC